MNIGILALQGSFLEHRTALERIGVSAKEVRLPRDLEDISGIIIPGGESTTQSILLRRYELFDPLKQMIEQGLPVWGTCAGAILLAKEVKGKNPPETLAVMNISADRNAYGTQADSFESEITLLKFGKIDGVFIRSPKLSILPGGEAKILGIYNDVPVMIQEKNMIATTFHPELTEENIIHEFFVSIAQTHDAFIQTRK